jgi:hypothetical protein
MAAIGQAFHHIASGTSTQYQQTPDGPVPIQVPNKPGQLFRSILAGALAGMGTAGETAESKGAGSPWASISNGAAAAGKQSQENQQRQDQQAQQQFENQQKAQSQASEEQLRKAQISMYNLEKLKTLHDIQSGDYTSHKQLVEDAKPIIQSYQETGLTPVVSNISETDHENYIKNHPGSASLDWQPSGVTSYVDSDNRVSYQTQWSAYDPKGNVVVPSSLIKDWKDSGLLDMNPNLLSNMKKNSDGQYMLPYSALTSLNVQNTRMKADSKAKADNDFQTKKNSDELTELLARTGASNAAAAASGDEAAVRSLELKQEKLGESAQTKLAASKGDWDKANLTPEEIVAMQPQIQKDIDGYRTELNDPNLKEQLSSNDSAISGSAQQRASNLQEQLDDARKHSIFVPPSAQVQPVTFINPQGQQVIAATQEQIDKATKLGYKKVGSAGAGSPDDTLTIQLPDGSTTDVSRSDYESSKANPSFQTAPIAQGKVVSVAPAKPPQTPSESLAGMDLTKGNSY